MNHYGFSKHASQRKHRFDFLSHQMRCRRDPGQSRFRFNHRNEIDANGRGSTCSPHRSSAGYCEVYPWGDSFMSNAKIVRFHGRLGPEVRETNFLIG